MTDAERQRLAAILGMLGSSSAGERDNAAIQAERLRHRIGATWEDLVSDRIVITERIVYVDRIIYVDCFIPPASQPAAPAQPVHSAARELLTRKVWGFPWWLVTIWGLLLGMGLMSRLAVACL